MRTPLLSPPLMKLDTRPRPCPSEIGLFPVAQLADCPGDVVDAEADVVQTFAVLVEPEGERRVPVERLDELDVGVARIQVREPDVRTRSISSTRRPRGRAVR